MGTSEFWFQSLQNGRSGFPSVLTIMVLSIFLRQRGSPSPNPSMLPMLRPVSRLQLRIIAPTHSVDIISMCVDCHDSDHRYGYDWPFADLWPIGLYRHGLERAGIGVGLIILSGVVIFGAKQWLIRRYKLLIGGNNRWLVSYLLCI